MLDIMHLRLVPFTNFAFFSFPEEISNLMNQVKEGKKNLSEMETVKKRIEQEKTEVQVALEEAEVFNLQGAKVFLVTEQKICILVITTITQ